MIRSEDQSVFLAGQRVPPGRYVRAEPPDGRTVELARPDVLPPSFDGHVAVYLRVVPRPATAKPSIPVHSVRKRPSPLD